MKAKFRNIGIAFGVLYVVMLLTGYGLFSLLCIGAMAFAALGYTISRY